MHECFWQTDNPINPLFNQVHIIDTYKRITKLPNEDKGIFTAICGIELGTKPDPTIGDTKPHFGTLQEAGASKVPVCKRCVTGAIRFFLHRRKKA